MAPSLPLAILAMAFIAFIAFIAWWLLRRMTEPMADDDVARMLADDADGYVASFSEADLHARGARGKDEYRAMSARAVRKPTREEAARLADTIGRSRDPNEGHAVTFAIVTDDRYEGGMPHTRANVVFLPRASLDPANAAALPGLLAHELTHIRQRRDPASARAWAHGHGYTECPASLAGANGVRANPDLDGKAWCTNAMQRVAFVYNSATPDGLRDGRITPAGATHEHPYEAEAYGAQP